MVNECQPTVCQRDVEGSSRLRNPKTLMVPTLAADTEPATRPKISFVGVNKFYGVFSCVFIFHITYDLKRTRDLGFLLNCCEYFSQSEEI